MHVKATDSLYSRMRRSAASPRIAQYIDRLGSEIWAWFTQNHVYPADFDGRIIDMAFRDVERIPLGATRRCSIKKIRKTLQDCHPGVYPRLGETAWVSMWEDALLGALHVLLGDPWQRWAVLDGLRNRFLQSARTGVWS